MIPIELGFMRHDLNNPERGQQLIDWAMAHGVNHFEHCSFYLNWQCEDYMYSLLEKYPRESYYICGKMPIHNVIDKRDFKQLFQDQIAKVPGHYFDTYILQAIDERATYLLYEKDVIPYFLKQKEKGIIKRFGLSIQCIPETFRKYLNLNCWDVVQMPINYYDWFLCRYNENYTLAREHSLPIIAQAPVKGGLLLQHSNIPQGSFIEYSRSNLEAAYDFISALEGIEAILCGNSNLHSFQLTYQAISNPSVIPFEQYKKVIELFKNTAIINCLNCGRCENVCEQKLPIAALFSLYNKALSEKFYFNAFDILKRSTFEPCNVCSHCNRCLNVCPIENNIPQLFRDKIFELRT